MRELCFEKETPMRLDRFLLECCPGISPGLLHKYLRENKIKLNGKRQALSTRLQRGDILRLYLPEVGDDADTSKPGSAPTSPCGADSTNGELFLPEVLFEDENLLAVCKPAGLLCQEEGGSTGKDSLLLRARRYVAQGAPPGDAASLRLCHRLDTGTSGVVLLAKKPDVLAFLEGLIHNRQLTKEYLCVTCGQPDPAADTLTHWLRKDAARGTVTASNKKTPGAKMAEARYETLATSGRLALLLVTLITGRTHQIRVQLAHIGVPVLGDSKYGNLAMNRELRCRYQCLCAWRLTFPAITDPAFRAYSGLQITCGEPWYATQVRSGTLQ